MRRGLVVKKIPMGKVGSWGIIVLYAMIVVLPLVWMFVTSIKPDKEVYQVPISYFVRNPTITQFKEVMVNYPFPSYIKNSLIIAGVTTLICTIAGTLGGYGFDRFNFRLKSLMLLLTIGVRIIPPIALVVPFYLLFSKVGLTDTLTALILVNTYQNLPFYIFIMMNFFSEIPKELDEAAMVDGAGRMGALTKVILPLSITGLAASSIICFLLAWNEFLYGLILTRTPASKPISVGVADTVADMFISWPQLCAGGVIATIPAIVFVLLFQRYIITGLVRGAIKG